jgi:dTDP-4-dehydrorhamnose reductase
LLPLDLRDASAVQKLLREVRPEVCYMPGALTFVDFAEAHPNECRQTNIEGVSHVARAMAELHGLLVFFSTEHVFGESARPWKEDDPVSPQSIYAKSKADAETIVRDMLPPRHLILRTSWVFGPDPQEKNFVWRVRRTLEKGETLSVPSDQHGQPTYGPDLASTARQLVARGACGTYHVVGPQYQSRLAWARLIAENFGLSVEFIQGRPTRAPNMARSPGIATTIAPRPLHVPLDRCKLLSFLGHDPIRPPQAGILDMARNSASCAKNYGLWTAG